MSVYYRLFTFGYEGTSYKQLTAEDITAAEVASMKLEPMFSKDGADQLPYEGLWFKRNIDGFPSLTPLILEIDADGRPDSCIDVYGPPLGEDSAFSVLVTIDNPWTGFPPSPTFNIAFVKVWSAKPIPGFWTNFRKCREIGSGTGAGGGSSPPIDATPPESAVAVTAPYAATLGAVGAGEIKWFEVTLAAGDYRFHTTDSPDPADYDTHLALFGADGKVIAESDDVDLDNSDYRSSITKALADGTYYVGLTGFGTEFSDGFGAALSGNAVPAGTIFKIEAA